MALVQRIKDAWGFALCALLIGGAIASMIAARSYRTTVPEEWWPAWEAYRDELREDLNELRDCCGCPPEGMDGPIRP